MEIPDIIHLNVGGHLFTTSRSTLLQLPDTMLGAMFSGRFPRVCTDGSYFIDRDGTHFRWILNYLRDPTSLDPLEDRAVMKELLTEAKYYRIYCNKDLCTLKSYVISPLVDLIHEKLEIKVDNRKHIYNDTKQADAIVTVINSLSMQVEALNLRLVWKQTKLECDTVLIAAENLTNEVLACCSGFLELGGTVVIIGSFNSTIGAEPGSLHLPMTPGSFRPGMPKLCGVPQKSLLHINHQHPLLNGVESFMFKCSPFTVLQTAADVVTVARWDNKEPAVVVESSYTNGLIIFLNFHISLLEESANPNMNQLIPGGRNGLK